ncbi:MAG: stage IV sporulation protein FB [Chlamydiales bacterium]|jgi:stage IV sporulation protein FB
MLRIPGRIPITINPLFLLITIVFGIIGLKLTTAGIFVWVAVVLISVLVHEFGHALTALYFDQEVAIELTGLGGMTYQKGPRLKLWQEFLVVLNGPIAGLMLFLISFRLRKSLGDIPELVDKGLIMTQMVNLYWNLINLIPIVPLDGGRLMNITLEWLFGVPGIKFSLIFGTVLGVFLGLFFFSNGIMVLGVIMTMLSFESFRAYQDARDITNDDRNEDMLRAYEKAKEALSNGSHDIAYAKFEEVSKVTGKGQIHISCLLHMAHILNSWGESKKAYNLLEPVKDIIPEEALDLLHGLAFYTKNYDLVVELGARCYQENPSSEVAFYNAVAFAALGDVKACIGWLQCARSEAMPNLVGRLQHEDFDKVRDESLFKNFEKLLR